MAGSVYAAFGFLMGLYNMDKDHGTFALDMLTACQDTNSWCNMITQGATATMEAWTPDEKPNLSWSHPWATAPVSAILRGFMGITPLSSGYSLFRVKPQPGVGIITASAKVPTLSGWIFVNFQQNLTSFALQLTSPANMLATVCLPSLGSSDSSLLVDGVKVQGYVGSDYVCIDKIGSGNGPRVITRSV